MEKRQTWRHNQGKQHAWQLTHQLSVTSDAKF